MASAHVGIRAIDANADANPHQHACDEVRLVSRVKAWPHVRIDAIHVENFLSFDTFTWSHLDPEFNVLVGPNGVGKTNLFHAFRTVRGVVRRLAHVPTARAADAVEASRWMREQIRHCRDDSRPTRIEIDVALTTAYERQVLTAFMAAALFQPATIQEVAVKKFHVNADIGGLHEFANWLETMAPSAVSWLFTGTLVVSSRDGGRTWDCQYCARPGAAPFWWDLQTPGMRAEEAAISTSASSLFEPWFDQLDPAVGERLLNVLTGKPGGRLPDVLALDDLPNWVRPSYDKPLSTSEWGYSAPRPRLLDRVETLIRGTPASAQTVGARLSGSDVWYTLLESALVITSNVRIQPQVEYPVLQLREGALDMSDGKDLAAFLHRLKEGDARQRSDYVRVQRLFTELTGRRFEVGEVKHWDPNAATPYPSVHVTTADDETTVPLALVVAEPWGDVPLGFSGAGIAEALFFSTLAAGSQGQVILLDEPALNLHPTMMTGLMDTMVGAGPGPNQPHRPASQFLISTHSPWLIPSDAVDRIARFTMSTGQTGVHSLHTRGAAVSPGSSDLMEMRNALRRSPGLRSLLFGRAVILVEGETELGALPLWWDTERRDVVIYSVGGKGSFVSPIKFLQAFSIPWVVLCDGDALWDSKQQGRRDGPEVHVRSIVRASHRVLKNAAGDPGTSVDDFNAWRKRLESKGIYSLARTAREGFERAVEAITPVHVWQQAHAQYDENKVAVGRYVAEQCPCPPRLGQVFASMLRYLKEAGADL